jgi:hypothetical protein
MSCLEFAMKIKYLVCLLCMGESLVCVCVCVCGVCVFVFVVCVCVCVCEACVVWCV